MILSIEKEIVSWLGAKGARRLQEVSSRAEETGKTSSGASSSAVGSASEACMLGGGWGYGANWSGYGGANGGGSWLEADCARAVGDSDCLGL